MDVLKDNSSGANRADFRADRRPSSYVCRCIHEGFNGRQCHLLQFIENRCHFRFVFYYGSSPSKSCTEYRSDSDWEFFEYSTISLDVDGGYISSSNETVGSTTLAFLSPLPQQHVMRFTDKYNRLFVINVKMIIAHTAGVLDEQNNTVEVRESSIVGPSVGGYLLPLASEDGVSR